VEVKMKREYFNFLANYKLLSRLIILLSLSFINISSLSSQSVNDKQIIKWVISEAKINFGNSLCIYPSTKSIEIGRGLYSNISYSLDLDERDSFDACESMINRKNFEIKILADLIGANCTTEANFWLSPIGYNNKQNIAVIYIDNRIVPGNGHGDFLIFIKDNDSWVYLGAIWEWSD
jgi:hypothetical protein